MSGFVIRGAQVVDGTGGESYVADVVVRDGRIASIHREPTSTAPLPSVDGGGLALCPGFIDLHAHSDLAFGNGSTHLAKISQGITTEVIGQDGLGYAPTSIAMRARLVLQIAGWNDAGPLTDIGWDTVADYRAAVESAGTVTNLVMLVPQGNLRWLVVGDGRREASAIELRAMQDLLRNSLVEGASGMSGGLSYTPGAFATTDELVALCRVVAEHGGFFAPHVRSYGRGALESYREAIDIGRRSGCAVHLTHAHLSFPESRGRATELLDLIDEARDGGLDVTLDSYPYDAGSTTLVSLLPHDLTTQGVGAIRAALADEESRRQTRHVLESLGSDGAHGVPVDWRSVRIGGVRSPALADTVGRSIAELAEHEDREAFDVFAALVADDATITIIHHVGDEANVRTVMRHPAHTAGTDGILAGQRPHPRAWGTFPRYLGRYHRELGLLGTLPQAVTHLTSRAAARIGLADRGLIAPGYAADLVLFDPNTVADTATYEEPCQVSAGIERVWVNGTLAYHSGATTGARAGRWLDPSRRTRGAR